MKTPMPFVPNDPCCRKVERAAPPRAWPRWLPIQRTGEQCAPPYVARRVIVLLAAAFVGALSGFAASKPAPETAKVTTALSPEIGHMIIDAKGVPPPPPLFFSATVDQTTRLGLAEITGEARVKLHVLQGKPEVLTLGLSGDGEIFEVTGKGLRDWSVRQSISLTPGKPGGRLLDLRPQLAAGAADPIDLDLVVRFRVAKPTIPGRAAVLLLTPGEAVGSSAKVTLQPDANVDARVMSVTGLVPLGEGDTVKEPWQFFATGEGRIEVNLTLRGGALAEAELTGAQLAGKLADTAGSVNFRLRGQLRAAKAGARLRILEGHAALSEKAVGDGWHVELVPVTREGFAYDLVADREGLLPVELPFVAEAREDGDWRMLDFAMPAGAVVPLSLEGLGTDVSFKPDSPIVPAAVAQGWAGFLPADGAASLAWKRTREKTEGTLFFTSSEQSEVRVGAGLLRQSTRLGLRVLQGKLASVRCRLEGFGEILGVEGTNVVGWKVVPEGPARVLEVQFSRPVETEGVLTIQSQTELGAFPVRAEPMRLVPAGVVRHSGFLRVANHGAVRLEVADATGMMQLAPAQFPVADLEPDVRQVFVYRFPSANYSYRVLASQIQPEVGVSEVALYELADTDRVINAGLELDVREAPLRDWSLQIPADYTVAAITGSDVADYVAESEATGGYRTLKVLFGRAIEGRQLLQLRLEKNQAAAAGDWSLPALRFPGAKSVRGHIGAVAAAGFRVVPAKVERLVEVPLSYFPRQAAGLQQAWRLREPDWSANLRVEALGQSIQADVFHLYSVSEGVVHASVLLNYFVVGAPASEWRLAVPAEAGNIDVVGQNVRRDWRREGDQVIVSLHQPVLGAATLLLTYEQPMSARGGTITPGEVRPLGVQAERGYLEVVSPLQVKHEVKVADGGLLKLEPLELPAEFRLLTTAPALAVYQYTARPFRLEMGLQWYAPGETADQVVDFARFSSQVSRDGQVVTDVRYFVKTRGRKALRLILPAEVKLWEARVDNEMTNARVDGEYTIIPLPARLNPNEPVSVALRLGQAAAGSGRTVKLLAPRTLAPTVIGEWTLKSDAGYGLVPQGGNIEVIHPGLKETGYEWLTRHARLPLAMLFGLVALSALLLRSGWGWRLVAGMLFGLAAIWTAVSDAGNVISSQRGNVQEVTYAATMVPAGETVFIQVGNVVEWRAMIVGWGVAAAVAGMVLLGAGLLRARRGRSALVVSPALALLATGLLAQRGGAVYFFIAAAVAIFLLLLLPALIRWKRGGDEEETLPPVEPGTGPAAVVSLLAVSLLGGLAPGSAPNLQATEIVAPAPWLQPGAKAAQAMAQNWTIRENRLYAEVDLTIRGGPGDSFLLLRAPAVLTDFKGDGLRVGKVERDGTTAYYVAPDREGVLTAHARFEMPVPDRAAGIPLPTGPAATQRVTLELDQGGWEFVSPMAVQILPTPGLGEDRSGATLVLAPQGAAVIKLQPRRRNVAAEATQFFAEVVNLYVPGPGVVNGFSRVAIRPVQGRVAELDLDVPAGLTVGEVGKGPVGAWRFDPVKRRLHVAIEPAQTEAFRFDVETQLGAGALPFDLGLEPLRVVGAAGEVGTLALAFGGDAQPEAMKATGLSAINVQDFEASLVPATREGRPLANVQQVWRYGQAGGRVDLKVSAVAPEVRVAGRQVLSLDDDRLVMAVDLQVAIMRVGLFKLSFALPEGLEVEALSGAALSQWTEAQEGSQRVVTLHLNGRTIGDQGFSLTLVGAAPRPQAAWPVPRLRIREATRQTGDALIVPGKGLRLRAVDREKVTQVDPRTVGGLQPGTLAFHLLQEDWVLTLGLEALEPWVTVQALQEVTLREGQTLTRIGLRYRVENAALKQFRVRLPGLGEEGARTVRATGPAVSEIVRVAGEADLWEIHFQRGIAGETDVQIEFQGPAVRSQNQEAIPALVFPGARQAVQFVAVRASGRLELEAANIARGWTKADWSAVPADLQDRSDRSVPALCFRVAEPEGALLVGVRRHEVAEALKLRVTQCDLTTLFSAGGAFITAVELKVDVLEKSTLRVRLPERSSLYHVFVNGESVSVVREGDAYLFHVAPNTGADRAAAVRLVYAAAGAGPGRPVGLVAPSLNVPLENATWRVVVPPGYDLRDYQGGLRLQEEGAGGSFRIEDYESLVESRRSANAQQAVALLQEANTLLQRGDQWKAGEVLSRVSNANALDEASNEDARVQLRNLKTQQTVIGLNTRRQKLYLDNRIEGSRNEQLEQAAIANPLMRNNLNFNPQEIDRMLAGNSAEENTALKGIAARLVDQQLAAEPAPGAIDVTLTENGRVLTFTRSLQVDGGAPLELTLKVGKTAFTGIRYILLLLLALAGVSCIPVVRRSARAA
ncbi:MAG TPA: hypothetical protein VG734_02435 [Lacunisphaera sp.]|nr:hypothetical protein [Lacunisphaera sp.]